MPLVKLNPTATVLQLINKIFSLYSYTNKKNCYLNKYLQSYISLPPLPMHLRLYQGISKWAESRCSSKKEITQYKTILTIQFMCFLVYIKISSEMLNLNSYTQNTYFYYSIYYYFKFHLKNWDNPLKVLNLFKLKKV